MQARAGEKVYHAAVAYGVRPHRLLLVACAPLAVCCAGRNHLQREGNYQFRTTEILSDPCGIASGAPRTWAGVLQMNGDEARMQMDSRLFTAQSFNVQMDGYFLSSLEQFKLDGSVANLPVLANGGECLVNLIQVHLEATTQSAQEFAGTARVNYQNRNGTCLCELQARYGAVLQ